MPITHATEFEAFGTSHQVAILVLLAGALALAVVGRRRRDTDPDDRLGKAFAVVIVCVVVPLQIVYFTPEHWSIQRTLPVQLCDLASVTAAYSLWTHRRWAAGLTYYWGLTLTTQAVATPDLATPFPEPIFLLYWAMHIGTVWAAVYLTWGRGITLDWRSYRIALITTAVWAAFVFALNQALTTNYGYLNAKPGSASILDLLGPWPWYVAAEAAIIAAGWALFTWPWVTLDRRRAQGQAASSGVAAPLVE
jgi:hypothetical integral membrane protein (TIGR02206 family)